MATSPFQPFKFASVGFRDYVMFKTRATRAASTLNGLKNIPGKACVKRVKRFIGF